MSLLHSFAGKLIVSCQALPDEPLHGSQTMAKMAMAAYLGGAGGIVANGTQDIAAIKAQVPLPIIGVMNRHYSDSTISLTPTAADVHELMKATPELISIETGFRPRPKGERLEVMLQEIRAAYPKVLLLAAIATLEEAFLAQELGYDAITTAAYGYTPETKGKRLINDDCQHLRTLCEAINLPVLAEGGIETPEQAACALRSGAHSVVVGGAITRPQNITRAFVNIISSVPSH